MSYVMGIDVGTQGVRVMVCEANGKIATHAEERFAEIRVKDLPPGWAEQDPEQWWNSCVTCIGKVITQCGEQGIAADDIVALTADSTSGTIIPLDSNDKPLRNAIMYNDARAENEARIANNAGHSHCEKYGYNFSSTYALPKMLWIKTNEPEIYVSTKRFIHATDFIMGRITGDFSVTDISSALKSGCDLELKKWPDFVGDKVGIPSRKLPKLVMPGDPLGTVSAACHSQTGLSTRTKVLAGMTDGMAGFFSSGASKVTDLNSTIGTTLVLKAVCKRIIRDVRGRIYCHRHPDGHWIPGGASNVGGEAISKHFKREELDDLNANVLRSSPSSLLVYPLEIEGERMPFANSDAQGFRIGEPKDRCELYASHLEGVAFVERCSIELLERLGAEIGDKVFASGGATRSTPWLQIRSDILKRTIMVSVAAESVFGCCILAAARTIHPDISSAINEMVKIGKTIEPRSDYVEKYEERYNLFLEECRKRDLNSI